MPRSTATTRLHGFVAIDKPAGWTSHDVVARARRLLGERRIGHAGTLDPAATGVLPLAVGDATRVIEYLADASKTYLAEITLGVTTDTDDADGRVSAVSQVPDLTAGELDSLLDRFRGPIEQVPPLYSAIKVEGRRLYDAARRGETPERTPRPVVIHHLELLAWAPPTLTALVDCSKGTYIRSLAADLGRAAGCGAHLSNLVRLRSGPFTLYDAVRLSDLEEAGIAESWPAVAYHPDLVLQEWPALILGDTDTRRWVNGGMIAQRLPDDASCRVYDAAGQWLGIGRGDAAQKLWRPTKVIARPA